jgi:predicted enzyme related to lactoylglutathione lyase
MDLNRAVEFYISVFGFEFDRSILDGNEMAFFPFYEGESGITGALAKGESYVSGKQGVRIYFSSDNIEETLRKVLQAGGKILYPMTSIGEWGSVAEFEDSEGNCIALHSSH